MPMDLPRVHCRLAREEAVTCYRRVSVEWLQMGEVFVFRHVATVGRGTVRFFSDETMSFCLTEIRKMAKKSKKEKAEGREKHRQMIRAKKMEKKQKKSVQLPKRHKK